MLNASPYFSPVVARKAGSADGGVVKMKATAPGSSAVELL